MVKVNRIIGSPYDIEEYMKILIRNRVPISNIEYGNIGDEDGTPFKPFRITINTEFTNDRFVEFMESFRKSIFNRFTEHVYVCVNDTKVINVHGDCDIDYENVLD